MTTTPNTTTAAKTRTRKATPASTKKAPAKAAAAKPATAAAPSAPTAPRTLAVTEGTKKCAGECGQVLPVTKFPTSAAKPGEVPVRGPVCRSCMKARRDANAAKAASVK